MKKIIVLLSTLSILFFGITFSFGFQAVSEEAQRHFDRGQAAIEMAKSPNDYDTAIREFEQAIRLAPGWPDVYYNLGMVQEKAGKYNDAITSLRQYLRFAPNASDAATIKSLINKLEFKAEQTITDEVALEIFGSLGDSSMWQLKGTTPKDSPDPGNLRGMRVSGRDGRQIVITYWSRPNQNPITMRVTPNGKTLSFETIYFLCLQSLHEDECPDWSKFSLEVVSRRYVKMSRKRFTAEIKPYMDAQASSHSYEFVRK